MRTCIDLVKELHYKMRIIMVHIDGQAIIFEDHIIVVNGASIPESKPFTML